MTSSQGKNGSISRSRLIPFRLSDVPEGIRLRAKDRLLATDGSVDGMLVPTTNFADRVRLGMAAENPSSKVYWVSAQAWERVMLKKNRRTP